jgi:hypothetical protein
MSNESNELNAIHPLADSVLGVLRDVAWNALVERFEEPFKITGEPSSLTQRRLDEALQYALHSGGQALLSDEDEVDHLDLLLAFARLVDSSAHEYAVVALTAPGKVGPLVSVFATKGGTNQVAVPKKALAQLNVRLVQKQTSKAVFVHNHPEGILHDIFGAAVLGPSAQDRQMLYRAYQHWFATDGYVRSEFYLVEGGTFRKFILPSANEVWDLAKRLGLVTTSAR